MNTLTNLVYLHHMYKVLNYQKLRRLALIVTLYLSGPLFIVLTDPRHLPLPLLVVPFLWLFGSLFLTTWLILKDHKSVSRRQVVMIAGVVASIPVLLMVFQSIHQLSLKDVLLSVGLVLLTAVYMLRADFIR